MNKELKKALQEVQEKMRDADISDFEAILDKHTEIPNFCLLVLLLFSVSEENYIIISSKLTEAEKKVWEAFVGDDVSKPNELNKLEGSPDIIKELLIKALFRNKEKRVTELLNNYTIDLNYQDMDGNTALHAVASSITGLDSIEVGKILSLLDSKINSKEVTFATILNSGDATALHCAAMCDNILMTKWLIDHGMDVSGRNKEGITALDTVADKEFEMDMAIAILDSYHERRKILTSQSIDYQSEDLSILTFKKSLMPKAIKLEHKGLIEKLLTIAPVLDIEEMYQVKEKRYTALQLAAMHDTVEIIAYLLDNNANINAAYGYTALHIAVENGSKGAIELLLNRDADVNVEDREHRTALHIATENGSEDVIQLLLDNNADINAKGISGTLLHSAAASGNTDVMNFFLEHGIHINSRDFEGRTALHIAASRKEAKVIELPRESGINVDAVEREDLYNANAIAFLLESGADINAKNDAGCTALYCAALSGNAGAIKALLDRRADINIVDAFGNTVLHGAARNGNRRAIQLLLDNGAKIDALGKEARMAIHYAAENGHTAAIELLLNRRADINAVDNYRRTALYFALRNNRLDAIKLLLERGANVNARDSNGGTILDHAIFDDRLEVVKLLRERGANVSETALHVAVRNKRLSAFKLLLDHGANVNATDMNGRTALYCAVQEKSLEALRLLLEHGADVYDVNEKHETALQVAVQVAASVAVQHDRLIALQIVAPVAVQHDMSSIVEILLINNVSIAGVTSSDPKIAALLEDAKDPNKLLQEAALLNDIKRVVMALGREVLKLSQVAILKLHSFINAILT
jgi:ankyrin repeat protein